MIRIGIVALLGITMVGCGNSAYVPVSGTITYNGTPLAKAQVIFQPTAASGTDTGGVGSFAMTNDAGQFTLEASTITPTPGAWVGNHTVRIALPPDGASSGEESDAAAPGKGKKAFKQPIPEKYNTQSTLTFSVPAGGTTTADFKLEGPPLPKR
ncbi:transthyretin-like family protein [Tuwongella immobilis]|uniref:Carboxypeptidase regulatory-like domain-containing protein n=1 Tax=Tuwongella immobilis TaxID=692036 RepID=A0A6C2YUV1_9BACT|nr:hypothetical protein [Tuwongella immobilis]VIP05137.1 Uncharacterized protein OS=Blastopirellula marina DSM 3645 GN=DSM3645_09897 PE=4 SV=1 [Tuwongella immobilis]VTS07630.1 Uncharacterized protein OS=Blastopirellula marina DSM 3645 GN=DSM3645_09897 PE=4 SV=1 [Tuwongella immobilis]